MTTTTNGTAEPAEDDHLAYAAAIISKRNTGAIAAHHLVAGPEAVLNGLALANAEAQAHALIALGQALGDAVEALRDITGRLPVVGASMCNLAACEKDHDLRTDPVHSNHDGSMWTDRPEPVALTEADRAEAELVADDLTPYRRGWRAGHLSGAAGSRAILDKVRAYCEGSRNSASRPFWAVDVLGILNGTDH